MTAVYVLRHPETTWNQAQRYQGRLESPLSAEGRRQSRLVIQAFTRRDLDVVVCSPLKRAHYLASELAQATGAPLHVDHRLTEIGQSVWEGLHLAEIKEKYPDMYEQWYLAPDRVTFPRGENLQSVQARSVAALSDLYARYPTGNVGVVTHSVVIQVLVAASLSIGLQHIHQLRVSNASITTLCGQTAPGSMLSLNCTESLYGGPVASAAAQECAQSQPRRVST